MNTQELLNIKERIEKGKTKVSELKGQLQSQLEILKNEHDCSSLKEAEEKEKELKKGIVELEEEIDTQMEELQEKYPELIDSHRST